VCCEEIMRYQTPFIYYFQRGLVLFCAAERIEFQFNFRHKASVYLKQNEREVYVVALYGQTPMYQVAS
jgi:hypothetical protein